MKKLLIALVLSATLLPAHAIEWKKMSFLNGALSVTVTNTIGITNLLVAPGGTNRIGTIYTNLAGSQVIVGTTTNAAGERVGSSHNLLGVLGFSPYTTAPASASMRYDGMYNTNTYGNWQGNAAIAIRLVGGSGANTATTFVFRPVYDGVNASTAESFVFSVTPNTTTAVVTRTNLPLNTTFNNCMGIRCDSITAGDTDASSQVTILGLDLIQLVP